MIRTCSGVNKVVAVMSRSSAVIVWNVSPGNGKDRVSVLDVLPCEWYLPFAPFPIRASPPILSSKYGTTMRVLLLFLATAAASPLLKPLPAPTPALPSWVTDLPRPTVDASHCNRRPGHCPAQIGYDCSGGCCGGESPHRAR